MGKHTVDITDSPSPVDARRYEWKCTCGATGLAPGWLDNAPEFHLPAEDVVVYRHQAIEVRDMEPRVKGHRLMTGEHLPGMAICQCGGYSPHLPGSIDRLNWHRQHLADIIAGKAKLL